MLALQLFPHNENLQYRQGSMPRESYKTYKLSIETTLKHSNATQNIYFSNFFDWQGAARERWFFECISADMLSDLGVFITKQAHNDYIQEVFPFQTLSCELNTFNIQRCSFNLRFNFYCKDRLVSKGYQQIVFANKKKRISRLPESIIEKIKRYDCKSFIV